MEKKEQLYEGKAKKVYKTDDPNLYIVSYKDDATAGDGVMSALQFIKAYISSGKKVSELRDEITIYPQDLVNAKVKNEKKDSVRENQEINNRIKEIEELIGDTGRVLIRPSGTEPLVRVMLEGEDIETLNEYANELAKMIEEKLGNN